MKSGFDSAGQFGIKPKIWPVIKKQEEKKEENKETLNNIIPSSVVIDNQNSTDTGTLTESFICPNCNAEFSDRRRLHGHMLKYTRNKK